MEPQLPQESEVPRRCSLNICLQGLLERNYESLSKKHKEHVRNVHQPWTVYISVPAPPTPSSTVDGVTFCFRRSTEKCGCFCETTFTSPRSLKAHVTGSNSDPPRPCPFFVNKANELARTGEVFKDAESEINYWPLEKASKASGQEDPQ